MDGLGSDNLEVLPARASASTWSPKLVFELALGLDPLAEILERHKLTQAEYEHLSNHPAFRHDLAMQRLDVQENGVTYKRKAAMQAESYLQDLHMIVTDSSGDVPASTRLDAIKYVTKVAELEPDKKQAGDDNSKQTINIQINV